MIFTIMDNTYKWNHRNKQVQQWDSRNRLLCNVLRAEVIAGIDWKTADGYIICYTDDAVLTEEKKMIINITYDDDIKNKAWIYLQQISVFPSEILKVNTTITCWKLETCPNDKVIIFRRRRVLNDVIKCMSLSREDLDSKFING